MKKLDGQTKEMTNLLGELEASLGSAKEDGTDTSKVEPIIQEAKVALEASKE